MWPTGEPNYYPNVLTQSYDPTLSNKPKQVLNQTDTLLLASKANKIAPP